MNIAELLRQRAQELPHKRAVVMAVRRGTSYEYPHYTFAQAEDRANRIAARLHRGGVRQGMRVLLFVRPRLDFAVLTFALFKLGAIPVLIDPGMGRKNLLGAVADVKPDGLVGEAIVDFAQRFFPAFHTVRHSWSVNALLKGVENEPPEFPFYDAPDEAPAAILFTSGGTGTPKGVVTTHGILATQTRMLQEMYALTPDDVDLPGFPLFALFTLAMGMTSVIPDMDPTKPAQCNPKKLVRTILEQQVSFAAGSPAIWERVGRWCAEKNVQLPSLKHVVMFGAPVRGEVHALLKRAIPFGETTAPYGATECLPVAVMPGQTILEETWPKSQEGQGTCVGQAAPGNKLLIDVDSHIPNGFPAGVGEVLVQGPTVTPEYYGRPEATAEAKIPHPEGLIHRMGDVGWLDERGRLWFCGRKAHVVVTESTSFYPIPIEAVFNRHPAVKRSALVGLKRDGQMEPAVVVELERSYPKERLEEELVALAASHAHTRPISRFFVHPGFPVDVRHNIKIDRLALARWAQGRFA